MSRKVTDRQTACKWSKWVWRWESNKKLSVTKMGVYVREQVIQRKKIGK
jgi:hypothetical protein